jgi:LPXTG-motif cell wall-anchored protein
MDVIWVFTTVAHGGGGGGGGGGYENPPEEIEVSEGEDVLNPEEIEDEQIIVPADSIKMPDTGVESPLAYYVIGAGIVAAGVLFNRKKKKE